MRAIRRFTVRTVLPDQISALDTLALNLRWSWHEPTRDLFASIDRDLWQQVHGDPSALLGALGEERLMSLAQDTDFVERVRLASEDLEQYLSQPRWYQNAGSDLPSAIAYFSAEFGITSVLPQYSGGLGILAGDHLKSASDLGVPIIGVGLLYGSGYFRQSLTRDGWQNETYPILDPNELPLTLMRMDDGTPAEVSIDLPQGRVLSAHIWIADVGRVPLLLLDSNVPQTDDRSRQVTDRLYGGGGEKRLEQELLLGIGGVRALRLYSSLTNTPTPEVYHANEGHAGFLGLERIREMITQGLTFNEALQAVRAATVFTTHTPVSAGIDRFPMDYIRTYFGEKSATPGVDVGDIMSLGVESGEDGDPNLFNMAMMGLRLGEFANGVSKLHGSVSRGMFNDMWPGFDAPEVPITSITNGVHSPTWTDPILTNLEETKLSRDEAGAGVGWLSQKITDEELWQARRQMREQLVMDARRRVRDSWLERGASPAELDWVDGVLDPDVLTIGFARRVPTYKRLTLMLRDPQRLTALLNHPEHPIQLVIAGKSHPADDFGKRLIQQLVKFADDPQVRQRIVFLPNYEIEMAQILYPGCDVWLNNPLRPLEACGTSGMKAALNGGLNLSILDGWWDEWYDGENGWAIPTADGVEDPDHRDDLEAAALYNLIENNVAPRFYTRDDQGLPTVWLEMIRHTLATLGPKVQATRMVTDYVERLYTPAAKAGRVMRANNFEAAKELAAWKARIIQSWSGVRVEHVESGGVGDVAQVGDTLDVQAYVTLGDINPDDVHVEVVHGKVSEKDEISGFTTTVLNDVKPLGDGRFEFAGNVELNTPGPFGYTARVVPHNDLLTSDAEMGLVTNPDITKV